MHSPYIFLEYFLYTKARNAKRAKHSNKPLTAKAPVSKGFQCLLGLISIALTCISLFLIKKILPFHNYQIVHEIQKGLEFRNFLCNRYSIYQTSGKENGCFSNFFWAFE